VKDSVVGESQHGEALSRQRLCARRIAGDLVVGGVRRAIDLDHKLRVQRSEVRNKSRREQPAGEIGRRPSAFDAALAKAGVPRWSG